MRFPYLLSGALLGVLVASCGTSTNGPGAGACGSTEVVVAASDYSSSMICGVPGECRSGADLGGMPQLAESNGRLFYLARDNDLVFELDPACGTPIGRSSVKVDQNHLSSPHNPHDVAVAPDGSLFVVLYNVPQIAILRDGRIDGTIDLSSYDPDGNPQAEAIRIVDVGGAAKAFVTLERLDDHSEPILQSRQPSYMLRIDVATRAVEAVITLAGRNPFNPMSQDGGGLFFGEPGNFNADDEDSAGIERFDVATSTSRLLATEKDLHGSVSEIAVANGCGAAILAGPQKDVNPTWLVSFDAQTGKVSPPLLGPTPGFDLGALAWRGNVLYVGDRRPATGGFVVHVFERNGADCTLHDTARTLLVPQRPVVMRGASSRP